MAKSVKYMRGVLVGLAQGLLINIRLGREDLTMTSTLAYLSGESDMQKKRTQMTMQ
jgi:hypothetical protein